MAMFGEDSMTILIKAKNETEKAFKAAQKNVKTFKGQVDKMQPAFKKMSVVGTAAFAAVAVGAGKAISKARDFEEETNKFGVVFKEVSKEAEAMADTLNKSYGLSRLESKRLLSSTGDILTGFGFAGDSALDLSGKVNTLAVDLASFTNASGGAEAVSDALTKALLGERESLKTYGIAIQEADVQAALLERGMDKLTGEALRQAKAQVTLDIAFKQSKNAVGDYARSTGSLTQTQKELGKTFEDIQISIGQTLAPLLNDILQKMMPVIEKVQEWIKENPKLTRIIVIATAALAALVAVVGLLGMALPPLIAGFTVLLGPVGLVIAIITGLIAVGVLLYKNWDKIKAAAGTAWEWIKDKIMAVVDSIKNVFNAYIDFWKKAWELVSNILKTALALIVGMVVMFLDWLFPSWRENVTKMIAVWTEGWNAFWDKASEIMGKIIEVVGGAFEWLGGHISVFLNSVKEKWVIVWSAIADFFVGLWQPVKEAISEVIDYIMDKIQKAIDMYNKMKAAISKPIKSAASGVGNFFSNAISSGKSILGFEHGGIVPGPQGAAVPIMAHGQEEVVPASQTGRGGTGNGMSLTIINPVFRNNEDERRLKQQLDSYFRPLLTNHKLSL